MKAYLNRQERENIVTMLVFELTMDSLLQASPRVQKLFGKHWSDMKRARTYIHKALKEGLAESLDQKEILRIHKIAQKCDFIVRERAGKPLPDKRVVAVPDTLIADLAELAIANHCRDCKRCDWQECRVFTVMQEADIPAAHMETGDCPYRQ
ncbi:hypothetical protein DFP93_101263 [Aneurinibacillus soli]|uniref:Uncharacterized protein n=1 Tax=Aneurinibacillus soli TaxID=1500254 RepID=A0A0U5AWS6_9BACL|nr:DUF5651 domain-containing protein [Aneurinibacillus soli]PYE64237.1 hypothetical protein DFP93_101263 [Aneurinibacillus soli]BAU28186.1 hypothetical protein CB4_02360 [Aneurinibacillus soli]